MAAAIAWHRVARRLALAAVAVAGPAAAHDTWFERTAEGLALGTGAHYPQQETSVGTRPPQRSGCRSAAGTRRLRALRDTPAALLVAAPPQARTQATTCWAQTPVMDITLDERTVARYLDEIRASATVRARHAEQQRRGIPWLERYAKHARIELGPPSAVPQPVPMALDIVLEAPVPRAGQPLCFRVWRDGQALAAQPVQLTGANLPVGLWLRTGDDGRTCVRVPLAGDWLLRGTELRPDPERADAWLSRFVTLAFRVD